MSVERILRDVPEIQVEQVKSVFESEGCSVEVIPQTDGKFTIKASCPD